MKRAIARYCRCVDESAHVSQVRTSVFEETVAFSIGIIVGVLLVWLSSTVSVGVGWLASFLVVSTMFVWLQRRDGVRSPAAGRDSAATSGGVSASSTAQRRWGTQYPSHYWPVMTCYTATISTAAARAAALAHHTWWPTLVLGPVVAAITHHKTRRPAPKSRA